MAGSVKYVAWAMVALAAVAILGVIALTITDVRDHGDDTVCARHARRFASQMHVDNLSCYEESALDCNQVCSGVLLSTPVAFNCWARGCNWSYPR